MSIHQVVGQLLAENSNTFDVLRIIAGEAKLSQEDSSTLRVAADELESAQRTLAIVYANLIEAQQRLIATNDRLIELQKQPRKPVWRMSTGWIQLQAVMHVR